MYQQIHDIIVNHPDADIVKGDGQEYVGLDWLISFLTSHCTNIQAELSYSEIYSVTMEFVFPAPVVSKLGTVNEELKVIIKKKAKKKIKGKSTKKVNIKELNKFTGLMD